MAGLVVHSSAVPAEEKVCLVAEGEWTVQVDLVEDQEATRGAAEKVALLEPVVLPAVLLVQVALVLALVLVVVVS